MGGVYVHFPFCRSRCLYCGFFSSVGREAFISQYCTELAREAELRLPMELTSMHTLYYGGGTPSIIAPHDIIDLTDNIRAAAGNPTLQEFTIEVNPDDVDEVKMEAWRRCGVTRFSIGVQSFNSEELRRIGRRHSPEKACRAIESLHKLGDVGIDLICGLPGQSIHSWQESVDIALSMRPEHISVYMLSLDEGSAMTRLWNAGKLTLPDDDTVVAQYLHFADTARAAGYCHYEVSNFSLSGKQALHNSSYWDGSPYIGLGAGACGYDGTRTRRTNLADLSEYLKGDAPHHIEVLDDDELHEEYLLTRLRRIGLGVDMQEYKEKYGQEECSKLLSRAAPYISKGVLNIVNHGISGKERLFFPDARSILMQDRVIADLASF